MLAICAVAALPALVHAQVAPKAAAPRTIISVESQRLRCYF